MDTREVEAGGQSIGGGRFAVIAGPCTVESRESLLETADCVSEAGAVAEVADVVQVGARNMQNYSLLTELGRAGRPVLLKRGLSASLDELLMAAEYVTQEGNPDVVLCERGIRT